MHTSVALIIFNRPDLVEQVFHEISKVKPPKLFIIADGPRENRPEDIEKCAAARKVVEQIDWDCEVYKKYSDNNLGCGVCPSAGISWVFEHVEEAIILEDDCLPHPSFFRYCEELLDRYKDDKRIMQISGTNYLLEDDLSKNSYFFSCHNLCAGGWATWKRAWDHFDLRVNLWPALKETRWLEHVLFDEKAISFWGKTFEKAYESTGPIDYWDHQWTFAFWAQSGLSVLPVAPLVSNIGFREDGTHTLSGNHWFANLQTEEMLFPLRHPPYVVRSIGADKYFVEKLFSEKPVRWWRRFFRKSARYFRKLIKTLRL